MKKFVLVVIVVILLSLLLLPFATGMIAQTRLEERVAEMNENAFLSADLASYERGWTSSSARLELGLSDAYADMLRANVGATLPGDPFSQRLVVLIDIDHGPVVIDDGVYFGMAKILARSDPDAPYMAALESVGMPYLFEFHGRAGFGGFTFDADVPPADFSSGMGQVMFSGINVEGSASRRTLTTHGNMASTNVSSPFLNASIENLNIDTDNEFLEGRRVSLGTAGFNIDRIVATSPMLGTDPAFTLEDLRLASETRFTSEDTLAVIAEYSVGSVAAGADFSLSDAVLRASIENLDVNALEAYGELVETAMEQQGSLDAENLLSEVMPLAEQFLRAGPVLRLDPLRFTMAAGSFSGSLAITVDASAVPSNAPIDFSNPALLAGMLSADAEATVDKPLAEEIATQIVREQIETSAAQSGQTLTPEDLDAMAEAQAGAMLAALASTGMLTDTGGTYSTTLSFADGQLNVNGAPIPLGLP